MTDVYKFDIYVCHTWKQQCLPKRVAKRIAKSDENVKSCSRMRKTPKLNFIKFFILQEWKVDYQQEDMSAITILLSWR